MFMSYYKFPKQGGFITTQKIRYFSMTLCDWIVQTDLSKFLNISITMQNESNKHHCGFISTKNDIGRLGVSVCMFDHHLANFLSDG